MSIPDGAGGPTTPPRDGQPLQPSATRLVADIAEEVYEEEGSSS